MNRDFIFRSIKKDSLDYLGYVLNVSSKKELFIAISELGFNPEALEYRALEINSKAIAICLPFRGNKELEKLEFCSLNKVEETYLSPERDEVNLKGNSDSGTFPADIFTGS